MDAAPPPQFTTDAKTSEVRDTKRVWMAAAISGWFCFLVAVGIAAGSGGDSATQSPSADDAKQKASATSELIATTTSTSSTSTTAPPPTTSAPTTEAPRVTSPPTTERAAAAAAAPSTYYANCTAARSAGVTPIKRGEPGYASHLDRDNDGIACE